jgi:hypothetical protein
MASWPLILAIVILASRNRILVGRLLAGGLFVQLAVAVLALFAFTADAIALVTCSAGDNTYCIGPVFFGDALFVAWLLVNVLVQSFIVAVFNYWSAILLRSAPTPVSTPTHGIKKRAALVVVVTALLFMWLVYMIPMFWSRLPAIEFILTVPVGTTIALMLFVATGVEWTVVTIVVFAGVPLVMQLVLLGLRSYAIARCAVSAANCLYGLYPVDVLFLVGNLVLLIFQAGAIWAIQRVKPVRNA